MKRIIGALLALLISTPVWADSQGANVTPGTAGTQSTAAGCVYRSGSITPVNGQQMGLPCASDGSIIVSQSTVLSQTIIGTDAASTNGSSTVATGNTFQTALAASSTRKGCLLYNPSTATEPLYVSFAASPSTTTNSIILGPGDSLSCAAGTVIIDDAVKVTAATTSHVYILYSQ